MGAMRRMHKACQPAFWCHISDKIMRGLTSGDVRVFLPAPLFFDNIGPAAVIRIRIKLSGFQYVPVF